MRIDQIIVPFAISEKLIVKHAVQEWEVQELLSNNPRFRFAEKGHTPGENVYSAMGRTYENRYLIAFFVYKPANQTAIIISARDMSRRERKQYGRK